MGHDQAHRLVARRRPGQPDRLPDEFNPFRGVDFYEKMSQPEKDNFSQHQAAWTWSQFLHGEQGAMVVSARIVETVPDLDSKFYAATQTMDEARHVETFAKFLQDKVDLMMPVNDDLAALLKESLDKRSGTTPTSACRCSSKASPSRRSASSVTWPPTRSPSSCSPTSCRTRRATSRSAGWRCATTTRS